MTKTKPTFLNHSIVVQFQLSDIQRGNDFGTKFYCHILADTFWDLLHNQNLSNSVREIAEKILSDYLGNNELSQLKTTKALIPFRNRFKKYITENVDGFEQFFFYVISEVSQIDTKFSFVYLADELDSLAEFPQEIQEIRLVLKQLIRRAFQEFKSKIRLFMYLVGTSNNVGSFIAEDSVIQSLIGDYIINLNKGYNNEFDMIREKIDERIKGAYNGYKNFNQAWEEIEKIPINATNSLREFCRSYGGAILEIHEKYFQEAPEQVFEGDARDLVMAECNKKWASFLNKTAYTLSTNSTTSVIEGHAFDCYIELLHNNKTVARAFGEAKNYEILSSHLDTFIKWLNDVKFNPSNSEGMPYDLAFIIAPSCPLLLHRKLELRNIQFIKSQKISHLIRKIDPVNPDPVSSDHINVNSVNLNAANKAQLTTAFRGTGIKQTTIDRLINRRKNKTFNNLDQMVTELNLNYNVTRKLQAKLDKKEISFS